MTHTSHGHHIGGTALDAYSGPVARCGGPGLCRSCSSEAAVAQLQRKLEMSVHRIIPKTLTMEALRFSGSSKSAGDISNWLSAYNYEVSFYPESPAISPLGVSCMEAVRPYSPACMTIKKDDFGVQVDPGQWVILTLETREVKIVTDDDMQLEYVPDPRPATTRWNYRGDES